MIQKYVEAHAHVWPEIIEGQREVGILDMQIYRKGRNLFMICDTVDDFDWERDMARLATLPRQAEGSLREPIPRLQSRCQERREMADDGKNILATVF